MFHLDFTLFLLCFCCCCCCYCTGNKHRSIIIKRPKVALEGRHGQWPYHILYMWCVVAMGNVYRQSPTSLYSQHLSVSFFYFQLQLPVFFMLFFFYLVEEIEPQSNIDSHWISSWNFLHIVLYIYIYSTG